jgi:nucleoside-triphosphatase THEP1
LRENVFLKETVKAKETLVKELETSLETSRAYVTFIHEECRRTAREAGAQIVDTTHAGDANVAAREAIRKLRGRRT